MARISPSTRTINTNQTGQDKVIVLPSGVMTCPNGYELIKADNGGRYDCSGGGHTYQIPPDCIERDIYGNLFIKPTSVTVTGEEK